MTEKKAFIIEVDEEFMEILKKLELKIKAVTWDGMDKISKKSLTKILAKKINSAKII